jgi:membrane protease subunit HflK
VDQQTEYFMAWNEPGGGNKDPWSGKGGDQGPPELDEVVRKLQEKLGGLFGGRQRPSGGGNGGDGGSGGPHLPRGGSIGIGLIAGILVVIWILSGIYIVDPAERGVELRFGAYTEVTQPGPHWHMPWPIEQVVKVNVDQLSSFRHKAQMLTKDENIVDIELTVQSRIQDPVDFLFQDQTPEKTMRDATETIVREIIGKSKLDFILTEGRSRVAASIQEGVQGLIDQQYKTGLQITSVNMQPAKPPEQVKGAFDDAIKAREDKERLENKAEAYANQILPQARGEAARVIADAKAYRDRVIAEAEGDASRFLSVLTEYEKAPEVTRERLYLDAVRDVLAANSKVIVDVAQGSSLMYLPLDKMLSRSGSRGGPAAGSSFQQDLEPQGAETTSPPREVNRGRRVRR